MIPGDGTVALESITRSNAVDDHHAIAVNQRRNPTIGPEIAPVDDEDLVSFSPPIGVTQLMSKYDSLTDDPQTTSMVNAVSTMFMS